MAKVDSDNNSKRGDAATDEGGVGVEQVGERDGDMLVVRVGEEAEDGVIAPSSSSRYVLSAFFAAGIAAAYVLGKAVSALWSKLANSQSVVDSVAWLAYTGEEFRDTWGMVAGGVLAVGLVAYAYSRKDVRVWVNEAAVELGKVTWPNKEEVINGTVVVLVTSFVAMIYLMLLDRFWGFVTDLVYRA